MAIYRVTQKHSDPLKSVGPRGLRMISVICRSSAILRSLKLSTLEGSLSPAYIRSQTTIARVWAQLRISYLICSALYL